MSDVDPIALTNEARITATKMAVDMHREIKKEIVTRPIVSNKQPRDQERISYLGVRNNESQIGAMVDQYGLKTTIAMLKEQERKLQQDKKGGRYE